MEYAGATRAIVEAHLQENQCVEVYPKPREIKLGENLKPGELLNSAFFWAALNPEAVYCAWAPDENGQYKIAHMTGGDKRSLYDAFGSDALNMGFEDRIVIEGINARARATVKILWLDTPPPPLIPIHG